MKTLVVSHAAASFAQSKGGADVIALRNARFLQGSFGPVGYVGILSPDEIGSLTYFPVRDTDLLSYDRLGPQLAAYGYLLNHLFRAAKAALVANRNYGGFGPDLVIVHTSTAAVMLKTLHPRTPLVYQIHDGLFAHRTVHGRLKRLVRFLMNDLLEMAAVKRAQYILCVSSSIELQLRNAGVPEEKLSVVPFVPNAPTGDNTSPSADRTLVASHLSTAEPFILSVGQQTGRKRFDLLIEAMPLVKSPLHLVLAGDGPLHAHYRNLVDRLNLSGRVHLEQHVSDTALTALYTNAVAFMLVSENEGFPVTIAEALALGCPSYLLCPNIQSDTEYPAGDAHLIRQIPSPNFLAQLMDDAYRAHQRAAAEGATRTAHPERVDRARVSLSGLKGFYDSMIARVLSPTVRRGEVSG